MPINSDYSKFVVKDDDYTAKFEDDYITMAITSGKTVTMPKAASCSVQSGQNQKYVIADANNSSNDVTIAVQSGDTLQGISTLEAGENALLSAFGSTWMATGGNGAAGTSGFSGISGFSGVSGFSGASGESGFSGASGAVGESGVSGATGTSGTSGFSGVSGAAGASGASGASGAA